MCSGEQECKVLNTVPLRTMICTCPANTITDVNGLCKEIGKHYFKQSLYYILYNLILLVDIHI